ncbi:MAG: DUF2800 domain-containing protein [Negativicutes bacterium]|nr:DUF2800 domain-containing protein [Negativicutes bacterium]
MSKHALLSASSAKRWMSCPPSARVESAMPEQQSLFATEGSFAHDVAHMLLVEQLGRMDAAGLAEWKVQLAADALYTKDLLDYVQIYVDLVVEKINAARAVSRDAVILLEQKLDYSPWAPGGYGTGDVVLYADGFCEVIDLKYGKGVPVSAEENPQLRLYGLGALNREDVHLYSIDAAIMTIVQPRLDSITSETLAVTDLLTWAETEVKPKAQLAYAGKGEYCAGNWCRFCKIKHTCRARADQALVLESFGRAKPHLLTVPEVAAILGKADLLMAWAADVKSWALEQAEKHRVSYPGWKMVEGRSNRAYTDRQQVESRLLDAGYMAEVIHKYPELLGITEMEKLLGRKQFAELLEGLVTKPSGKPTLAPIDDKRPAINSLEAARADFADD